MPVGYGMEVEMRWSQPSTTGDVPSARAGHTLTLVRPTQAVLFGGCANKGPTNDVYVLDMSGSSFQWSCATPRGAAAVPPPRWRHSATSFAAGTRVAVFGGVDATSRLSDLWILNTKSMEWVRATEASANDRYVRADTDDAAPATTGVRFDAGSGAGSSPGQAMETASSVSLPVAGKRGWPSARGGHSANAIGGAVYLFGGYGGTGFGRKDFNEVWRFEARAGASSRSRKHQIWAAFKLSPAGEPPAPRSDHQATVLGTRLYISGGWSSLRQHQDIHVFDAATCAWSSPDCELAGPGPRWQHAVIGAVESVPHPKIFVFGGECGNLEELQQAQGGFLNSVSVLNCNEAATATTDGGGGGGGEDDAATNALGVYQWRTHTVVGEVPQPRADCAAVFLTDGPLRRIVLFGGWADRWLGDTFVLDVQEVVGPPYNINTIDTPLLSPPGCETIVAPITGGTPIDIGGLSLKPFVGQTATVRFECATGHAEAEGVVLEDGATISCSAPSAVALGPVECEVRVQIEPFGVSLTALRTKFHTVTDGCKSLAFGPGLLGGNSAGFPTEFVIQAVSADGRVRDTGGDQFRITVTEKKPSLAASGDDYESDPDHEALVPEHVDVDIEDCRDGKYVAHFSVPRAGDYDVAVDFLGTFDGAAGAIQGSPFSVSFVERRKASRADNTMAGAVLRGHLRKVTESLHNEMRKLIRDLDSDVPENDLEELLTVKKALIAVQSRREAQQYTLLTTRSALQHLAISATGRDEKEIKQVQELNERVQQAFDKVQEMAPHTADSIAQESNMQKQRKKETIGLYQRAMEKKQRIVRQNLLWDYETGVVAARRALKEQMAENAQERRTLALHTDHCEVFGFPEIIERSRVVQSEIEADMEHMGEAWDVIEYVQGKVAEAHQAQWSAINAEELVDDAKALYKRVNTIDKSVKHSSAFLGIKADAQNFIKQAELVQLLQGNPMQVRHWQQLAKALGHKFPPPPTTPKLTLGQLLDLNLHTVSDDVEDITDLSAKERKLELILEEIESGKGSWVGWRNAEWVMEPYKGTDTPLLKIDGDHYETLEKHQMDIQAQTTSKAMAHFEAEVLRWQRELNMVSDIYRLLSEIQRAWSYLEPLFIHSDEVKKELPETAARFKDIDADVCIILKEAWQTRNVLAACNKAGLEDKLEDVTAQLGECKKSLIDFLDGRKRQFPRFYFMSEADLLDVLSNGSNPMKVIVHVPKIYLATKTFKLQAANGVYTATHWEAGVGSETVAFMPPVTLDGKVEVYLQTIVDAMRNTMFQHLTVSLDRYNQMSRIKWVMHGDKQPTDMAQVILLVSAITFADSCESEGFGGLAQGNTKALEEFSASQVRELGELIKTTRTKLSSGQRKRVMCMITLDAHNRDIVTKMIRAGVQSKDHFMWQSLLKLRFCEPQKGFLDRDKHLREQGRRAECQILNAVLPYDYEYLGNGPRLVITPLTDRIYVTATQALNLKMGCAPAGPAGTGKTETTKDLASALGKACYVVNCSPEMDYKSMGNTWKGLASSGSWGCYDEFNRLIPEVLSVCSVQYKAICDGCKAGASMICVDGDDITLDPTVGAFITMNPGYLGRSTLPEGLKALFRPMTVMVPDLVLICENMLMAEGFEDAKILASKFYSLYSLLKALLSKQMHYDWGLRAVKSVLVVAGSFKRAEPDMVEDHLLMRALRDFNTPKIVAEDEVIFHGLLGDLFPGANPPRAIDEALEAKVEEACVTLGNDPDELFRLKVVQFEELTAVRHCVFIMGPAGAGKSQAWRTLAKARELQAPERRTKCVDINPKAISTKELYGYIVLATREWKDGLLSRQLRALGEIPDEKPKWLILDGDLDANWIESMNSVMDDNRMLTLVSGERIPLKTHMRMIFEIRDLKHATPATVSRAGVLYISTDSGSQWRSLARSWVARQSKPADFKEKVQAMFDKYLPPALLYIKAQLTPIVPVEDLHLVSTLLHMLDGMLEVEEVAARLAGPEWYDALHKVFVFCAIWACGSGLGVADDGADHSKLFSDWWRNTWRSSKEDIKVGQSANKNVNEYFLNVSGTGTMKFEPWSKNKDFFFPVQFDSKSMAMSSVMVPTSETCSVAYWMDLLIKQGKPVMMCGAAGTGKTQIMAGALSRIGDPDSWMSCTINFNFYTSSAVLQNALEGPIQKKMGTKFGPPGNAKLIYFVDDLNLPELDTYNTQSAIALLRQQFEYGRIYDRNKDFIEKHIQNTQLVACMNPTVGSFVINPRLQRHFTTFAVGMPSKGALQEIYETFLLKRDESEKIIGGHMRSWPCAFQNWAKSIINAALSLHVQVAETFRKTAKNFHYEFNIRHIANVFQGLLVAQPAQFDEPCKFVELWLHESERVYADRLVSTQDIKKYEAIAKKAYQSMFTTAEFAKIGRFFGEGAHPLIFCHFSDNYDEDREKKVYDQAEIFQIADVLTSALVDYNTQYAAMNLSLFDDAMRHVCRVVRIVLNFGCHALLVGVGGSGKQSLSRLSAFICQYTVKQIVINAGYDETQFLDDLREMYNAAGLKDEGIMFLLTDSQIVKEKFLVYLNDLLSSGVIPELYTSEEQDGVVAALSTKCKRAGLSTDRASVWNFFINRVRTNLHCCLCFSPVNESFRTRAARFPALVNCTVIDWFQPWPEDALHAVGSQFLRHIDDLGGDDVRAAVEDFLPFCFSVVGKAATKIALTERRHVYTTPKSYLEMVHLYLTLLIQKRTECDRAIERLQSGLEKIEKAGKSVDEISAQLKIDVADAEQKKSTAEGIAEKVGKEKATVEVENAKAEKEQVEVQKIQVAVEAQQKQADTELEAATPAVNEAMAALDTIDEKDVKDVARLNTAPGQVGKICEAVMVLLCGVKKDIPTKKSRGALVCKDLSWAAIKKFVLNDVKGLIKDYLMPFATFITDGKVPERNFTEVRAWLDGEEDVRNMGVVKYFVPEIIRNQSTAAAGLCQWCIAITKYYNIVVTVAPLREALAKAEQQLKTANERLAVVNAQVKELNDRLAVLVAQSEEAETTMRNAKDTVDRGMKKQDLAQRLTAALSSEKVRWAQNVVDLQATKNLLVGDVLLASAFISYIGPFTKPFRESMVRDWTEKLRTAIDGESIPISAEPNPVGVVATSANIASWQSDGLPSDSVSTENGTIVTTSARWPLLIDPQLQGIKWIRNKESGSNRNLQILRLGQPTLIRTLQLAIENGHSILIENIMETIDAILNPVICRAKTRKGSSFKMTLGDQELSYNNKFRLILQTKLSNPNFPPEVQAECALVNFTVTQAGLEDQMLALVVGKERPDLAKTSVDLVQQQNRFKIQMEELEDGILRRLAEAEGDITENEELIVGLEDAKRISVDIEQKSAEAAAVQSKIAVTSEKYRGVAARTALLFFLMNDLVKVHTYYIFSLAAFIRVFDRGVDTVSSRLESATADEVAGTATQEKPSKGEGDSGGPQQDATDEDAEQAAELTDAELADRCQVLSDSITLTTFNYIRRGLFERNKLMVATLLALRVLSEAGTLSAVDQEALVMPTIVPDTVDMGAVGEWLPDVLHPKLKGLQSHKPLRGLIKAMEADEEDWQTWFDSAHAEDAKLPGDYQKTLSKFDRLILLRALRPDRLPAALRAWVSSVLGPAFVTQPVFDMSETFKETSPQTPVFFVLFPGVDPTGLVESLGAKMGMTEDAAKFTNISMGQGQEAPAEAVLAHYAKNGGWLMLQNCHLMQSWVPTLERKFELCSEGAHADFRLFISAEPPPIASWKNMPESLMQACIKVANEAPSDIQSNLRRSWAQFSQELVDSCTKPKEFKGCLFSLCWFHAIILGRRRFGQQGWSKVYSFNTGDLVICASVLQAYLDDSSGIPYDDLRYVFGEIMYGGHITDAWDRRTNNTYLQVLFNKGLFAGTDLALGEGFPAPDPEAHDYGAFAAYIEDSMVTESPPVFGMHPNAEIGFLTSQSETLFKEVQGLSGSVSDGAGEGGGGGGDGLVSTTMQDLLQRLPENFNMVLLRDKTLPMLTGEHGPYVSVALQECNRMNVLLSAMRTTLVELGKGLKGQLNMSQGMEDLAAALGRQEVPGRNPFSACKWETADPATSLAWPSKKSLLPWFQDLLMRTHQLAEWVKILPERQLSLWLPGLFNPMAFLTALKQVTARSTGLPLDKLDIESHITTMWRPEEPEAHPHDGDFVHGLFLEGARWPRVGVEGVEDESMDSAGGATSSEGDDTASEEGGATRGAPHDVDGTRCAGVLSRSRLKELLPSLPLMYVKAVEVQPEWEPTAVGYLRNDPAIYDCPVYVTTFRGPTYVFLATLPTSQPVSTWVLAGVAIIFQTDD